LMTIQFPADFGSFCGRSDFGSLASDGRPTGSTGQRRGQLRVCRWVFVISPRESPRYIVPGAEDIPDGRAREGINWPLRLCALCIAGNAIARKQSHHQGADDRAAADPVNISSAICRTLGDAVQRVLLMREPARPDTWTARASEKNEPSFGVVIETFSGTLLRFR
jgi:hypothetical protein